MEYIIKCAGREWVTNNEYKYQHALNLNDTGTTSLYNERLHYVINACFVQKVKNRQVKRKTDDSIGSLHSLSQEMNKSHLSYEDEEWLDDIVGNDPYTPLY